MIVPRPDPHDALAQAWVLLRLGLHEPAAQCALQLAASAWGTSRPHADGSALWVGVVDILQAAGHGMAARGLIRDRLDDARCGDDLAGEWGAWLLARGGDDALALQCLQLAADAQPLQHEVLGWLTLALSRLGRCDMAWPRWQALFDQVPDDRVAREHGTRVWAWVGRGDRALACLQGIDTSRPDPADPRARLRDARIRHLWRVLRDEAPDAAPATGWLREAFEQTAAVYDAHLQALDNRGPVLLQQALVRSGIAAGAGLHVLDAGCGTGLCADVLRPVAARLDGLDLSPAMLAQARARGLYDSLQEADLCHAGPAAGPGADLVVCWDVLVYFGDLRLPLSALAGRLAPTGCLLLLVEAADSGCRCGIGGRHAHGVDHVRQALAATGLQLQWWVTEPHLRREFAAPVACHVAAATRGTGAWNP